VEEAPNLKTQRMSPEEKHFAQNTEPNFSAVVGKKGAQDLEVLSVRLKEIVLK
jgi:hypothetical protein